MRIILTSDTHEGITHSHTVEKLSRNIAKQRPDVIVHAGDFSGGFAGAPMVQKTVERLRRHNSGPIVVTIGNHDYWCGYNLSVEQFWANYRAIVACFKKHDIHFLDEDGPLTSGDCQFVGCTGWYSNPNPPTNDINFMPLGMGGDTHRYLFKRAIDIVTQQQGLLDHSKKIIFVSHFPVIDAGPDYKGSFGDFCWAGGWGKHLQNGWGIQNFFNGHSHRLHKGPLRWESGSDYYNPKFLVIDSDKDLK